MSFLGRKERLRFPLCTYTTGRKGRERKREGKEKKTKGEEGKERVETTSIPNEFLSSSDE